MIIGFHRALTLSALVTLAGCQHTAVKPTPDPAPIAPPSAFGAPQDIPVAEAPEAPAPPMKLYVFGHGKEGQGAGYFVEFSAVANPRESAKPVLIFKD